MNKAFLSSLFGLVITLQPFAAEPGSLRPWREYHTLMWVGESASRQPRKFPLFLQRLKEMGVNTAMVFDEADPQPFVQNDFPYYVENLVNRGLCLKFSSHVTDWDKFINTWASEGRPESAMVRDYCLDDPAWLGWGRQQIQKIVRLNRSHHPLAYNIRDELSVTYSANPFDYDFNPIALDHFRQWLKTQYPDLAALNAEWETHFPSWEQVRPFTTDQIKNRMASGEALPQGKPDWQALERLHFDPATAQGTRWNFSPWADFRTYMDLSLARALDELRQASHREDPATPVGIEGLQMPDAFGGYDLWRLSQVLDWAEPYDIGSSREILGSFMPGKPIMTTVFEKDSNHARRRLWHLLLEGDRACIIWWSEDCLDWKNPDYPLTPKAQALAPVLKEMTSPLAQLFLRAEPERDPVFIHYSQPSIQVDWLLESTVDGPTWVRRFSSFESAHNHLLRIRDGWLKLFQDLGYRPVFVSSEQIEQGLLTSSAGSAGAVLVLPGSLALSDKELEQIHSFLSPEDQSRTVRAIVEDGATGLFDQHARLRNIADQTFSFPKASSTNSYVTLNDRTPPRVYAAEPASYARQRLTPGDQAAFAQWVAAQLKPMAPPISVPLSSRVRIYRFRVPGARLVAFERGIDYQMSEDLKQAGGNELLEKPITLEARLPNPAHVYDLRAGKYLGLMARLEFTLDPWQPSLFALSDKKLPPEQVVNLLMPR